MNTITLRWGLLGLALLSVILCINIGPTETNSFQLYRCLFWECDDAFSRTLLWEFRLPRVIIGFLAGSALAIAGAILQNTTRNPLAEPYLLGIVSGAGLGAVVVTSFAASFLSVPLGAFAGAIIAISAILIIGKMTARMEHLILIGVAISFLLAAIMQGILYITDPLASKRILFWLMGSLADVKIHATYFIVPVILFTTIICIGFSRQIDAFLISDEQAKLLGVSVTVFKAFLLVLCALLSAVVVAFCGGIGFVGLMVPHIVRLWFGHTIIPLVLGSGLLGGIFLIWVDALARSLLVGQELPIGIITSLMGSLFFIIVLFKQSEK
ncbi:MAG: iron ABC transporter permease [Pseudomonadota bacterium]